MSEKNKRKGRISKVKTLNIEENVIGIGRKREKPRKRK